MTSHQRPQPHPRGRESSSAMLMHALTDCFFLRAGRHTRPELALYDRVIALVLARVEPLARAELAERLADEERPPPRVLMRLATDEITIARPILVRSPALTDIDLESIAARQSQWHLLAIASRKALSSKVTDVLVRRGDEAVVDQLAGNHGAQFSEQGIARLVERAAENPTLGARLSERRDLPAEIAARFAPLIRQKVAETLSAVAGPVPEHTRAALAGEVQAALIERLQAATKTARPVEVLIELMSRGLVAFNDAVIELADAEAAFSVARLIGGKLELRPDVVMRVLYAEAEKPMTVLCRAAGLTANGFSAVLRMRRRRRRFGPQPGEVFTAFAAVAPETAQAFVHGLRVRTERRGAAARQTH